MNGTELVQELERTLANLRVGARAMHVGMVAASAPRRKGNVPILRIELLPHRDLQNPIPRHDLLDDIHSGDHLSKRGVPRVEARLR